METTDSSSQPQSKQFSFSFFNNLWSKESTIITLHELYLRETSPLWKPKTESYRKLKARPDRENEAKMTKDSMPIVIVEGICRPHCSHAAANLEKMSSLAMYDFDHCGERTPEIKNLLCQLPYVTYAHDSISGEGLKIIVYLDVDTPKSIPSLMPSASKRCNASPDIPATSSAPASPNPVPASGTPTPTTTLPPNRTPGVKNWLPTLRWHNSSAPPNMPTAVAPLTPKASTASFLPYRPSPKPADISKPSSTPSSNITPGRKETGTNPCSPWEEAHDVRVFQKRNLKN